MSRTLLPKGLLFSKRTSLAKAGIVEPDRHSVPVFGLSRVDAVTKSRLAPPIIDNDTQLQMP
jgi:hypothetical protein